MSAAAAAAAVWVSLVPDTSAWGSQRTRGERARSWSVLLTQQASTC